MDKKEQTTYRSKASLDKRNETKRKIRAQKKARKKQNTESQQRCRNNKMKMADNIIAKANAIVPVLPGEMEALPKTKTPGKNPRDLQLLLASHGDLLEKGLQARLAANTHVATRVQETNIGANKEAYEDFKGDVNTKFDEIVQMLPDEKEPDALEEEGELEMDESIDLPPTPSPQKEPAAAPTSSYRRRLASIVTLGYVSSAVPVPAIESGEEDVPELAVDDGNAIATKTAAKTPGTKKKKKKVVRIRSPISAEGKFQSPITAKARRDDIPNTRLTRSAKKANGRRLFVESID